MARDLLSSVLGMILMTAEKFEKKYKKILKLFPPDRQPFPLDKRPFFLSALNSGIVERATPAATPYIRFQQHF